MGMLLHDGLDHAHAIGRTLVLKPKRHHTVMRLAATKDEVAEILIVSYEDSSFAHSPGQDVRIVGLRYCLSNGKHVVTGAAQVFDNRYTGRLIHDEVHGAGQLCRKREGEEIFMGQHLGCIGQRRADVIGPQRRVFPQDVMLRDALSEHPHDEFDGDASSPYDRLTSHDLRICADTLQERFVHRVSPFGETAPRPPGPEPRASSGRFLTAGATRGNSRDRHGDVTAQAAS